MSQERPVSHQLSQLREAKERTLVEYKVAREEACQNLEAILAFITEQIQPPMFFKSLSWYFGRQIKTELNYFPRREITPEQLNQFNKGEIEVLLVDLHLRDPGSIGLRRENGGYKTFYCVRDMNYKVSAAANFREIEAARLSVIEQTCLRPWGRNSSAPGEKMLAIGFSPKEGYEFVRLFELTPEQMITEGFIPASLTEPLFKLVKEATEKIFRPQ